MESKKFVIPATMYPPAEMHEIVGRDGKQYLVKNEAMFTGYQHSRAEFSEFFIAIRDKCKLYGNQCPKCAHIIVPPFMQRCPKCNFSEMQKIELRDSGIMAHSPVITMFAPSRFKKEVPFGTGYIYLMVSPDAPEIPSVVRVLTDSAIQLRVRTTTGSIRPGIFKKNTPVKIVFANDRIGDIADIFAVPKSELSREQFEKSPLYASDIDWNQKRIDLPRPTEENKKVLAEIKAGLKLLAGLILNSTRAKNDLKNWKRSVLIRTPAGATSMNMNGRLSTASRKKHDLVFTLTAPEKFNAWLYAAINSSEKQAPALTDLVMDGSLVLSVSEMETVTRLDRIPRSLRRDGVV